MTEIELFLDHLQSEDLTAGTLANYRGNLRLFSDGPFQHQHDRHLYHSQPKRFEPGSKASGLTLYFLEQLSS